jgi:hydrogenase maturation protein HypF
MTETALPEVETWQVEVRGTVQGVGYRPFVYRIATARGLRGEVRNTGGHVVVTVTGDRHRLSGFVHALRAERPAMAVVETVEVTARTAALQFDGFAVRDSLTGGLTDGLTGPATITAGATDSATDGVIHGVTATAGSRDIPPDLATCAECRSELFDRGDRRYRYPFVNCTACGPRATIIESVPYDRVRTTMSGFPMCEACAAEYADPADRRFHAEPVACPDCGPRLRLTRPELPDLHGDRALWSAAAAIVRGGVVAVKGLGGYQLMCDATQAPAVRRLRGVKGRDAKPLAVMVPDLAAARALAHLTSEDEAVLTSPAAPILLAPRRSVASAPFAPDPAPPASDANVLAEEVCDGSADVGVFLPYTPLHHLLLDALRRPLVVTSANRADSPMIIDDAEAERVLGPLVDGVLGHDRPILNRYDDSVVRSLGRRSIAIRRARGQAPAPLPLPEPAAVPIVAAGAQLKHTFAIASGDRAVLGPHTGDLADAETLAAFERCYARLCEIRAVDPGHVAHDLHPAYLSTRFAERWPRARRVAVQHHHAHVAAVAAEHGLRGPFLGVAYDGLGIGDDGTFWGGELLLATYTGYRRLGRFSHAPMPGGEAAVRRPARMALGYLLGGEAVHTPISRGLAAEAHHVLPETPDAEVRLVRRMIERRVNSPVASSAGRLFDAAAALLGVCAVNRYEGEAAMRLERLAADHSGRTGVDPLAWRIERRDGLWVYDGVATLADLVAARADGEPVGRIAAAFHATIAAVTVLLCERAAGETGVRTVCLSGGVFQNRLLADEVTARLAAAGFGVHLGERVPVNDGGIAYGQAVVAAARLAGRQDGG